MIPEKPKRTSVVYHLEDHRKNSGHLQKLLPSPCDGFYIPIVSFGQRVKTGDIIGHVKDVLGENTSPIEADQSGIIFILRSTPTVKKGDALGAILPANEDEKIQSIYE
jgi:predicted deacylase